MIDADRHLQNITKWRRSRKRDRTAMLGDTVREIMDKQISPRRERFGLVVEMWNYLLPSGLIEHCKIDGMSQGQLKILVDSPVFMHELRMCSPQLLEQLQQRCPRAGIRRIKFAIGR